MTSPYTLPSNTPRGKRKGEEAPADFELMLRAWNSGTPAGRDVAIEIADRNRIRALGANGAAK